MAGLELDRLPRVEMTDQAAWRAWLEAHHETSEGVWLVRYKKAAARPTLTWDEAVEELLCFGWIDSVPRKLDDERSMLLCTPRKPTSKWSALNKRRIAALVKAGRMAPAGEAAVARAKADGTWTALDAVEALLVPDDLQAALSKRRGAAANFEAFPKSVRKGILEWVTSAKRPETRAKRVTETADKAARNERANQ